MTAANEYLMMCSLANNRGNEMSQWHNICITDKTGKKFFPCEASPMATMSEIRNLQLHISTAKIRPDQYKFLDVASAMILLDGLPYGEPCEIDADQLLAELGL